MLVILTILYNRYVIYVKLQMVHASNVDNVPQLFMFFVRTKLGYCFYKDPSDILKCFMNVTVDCINQLVFIYIYIYIFRYIYNLFIVFGQFKFIWHCYNLGHRKVNRNLFKWTSIIDWNKFFLRGLIYT